MKYARDANAARVLSGSSRNGKNQKYRGGLNINRFAPRFPSGHFFPLFRSVNHFRDDSLPYKRYTYERKTVNSAEKFR